MLLDEIFKLTDRWGKFVGLLSAIAGLVIIFVGKNVVIYILILIVYFLIELGLLGILRQEEIIQAALNKGLPPPSLIYTEEQRRLAQWSIVLISIIVIGLAGWLISTYTYRSSIRVYSARYPFTSTGIRVNASDQVEITVVGQSQKWDCGRMDPNGGDELIGPDGYSSEGYSDTVFEQANVCALIGSISTSSSPEIYFEIGAHKTFTASDSGMLFLGCNDSKERFGDNSTGSNLEVEIVMIKRLNIIPILLAFIVLMLGGIALMPKFRQRVFPS